MTLLINYSTNIIYIIIVNKSIDDKLAKNNGEYFTVENQYTITVPEENHLQRIDIFLGSSLEINISRNLIQKLIKNHNVTVNGNPIKANYKVKTDDEITVTIPESETIELLPENIHLDILYQDNSIVVINKQPGIVVHPGNGNYNSTLINALLFHIKDLSTAGDENRPGIVHRLDRDTSGLMVIAKTNEAYYNLVRQFSERYIDKKYKAIVIGKPSKDNCLIDKPLARHKKYRHKMSIAEDGREALTKYQISKIWNIQSRTFSMLDIKIYTGRTHQIRVHMSSMGHPIVGDQLYSKKWEKYKVPYIMLAATDLSFTHPVTGKRMEFSIDIPKHMKDYIARLEKMNN